MSDRPTVRLMIVIGQVLNEPWLNIAREGQLRTWVPDALDLGISVRHSHGNRSGPVLRTLDRWHEWVRWHGAGRSLVPRVDAWVGKPFLGWTPSVKVIQSRRSGEAWWHQSLLDVYALQRWKVIGSLTQALQENFTHIYFTTASSYVRPSELHAIVESLPSEGVYAGTALIDGISGYSFASGANRLLSRDVVELVVENKRAYRNDVMEDVGLGRLLTDLGVTLTDLPTQNVSSLDELIRSSDAHILSNYHFRLKSGTRQDRHDVLLMHALHDRLRILSQAAGVEDAQR